MGTGVSASYGFTGSITEAQWAVLHEHPRGDYVSGCALSAGTGAREVDVASGTVWQLGGYHTVSGATVTLAENTSGSTRIDTIVLAVDYSGDDAALTYVQGTPSASPTPPELTRTAGTTWQVPLADVTVANGAGVLAASAVQDVRAGPWIDATDDLQGNWFNYQTAGWGEVGRRLSGTTVEWRGLIRNNGAVAYPIEPLVAVPYRWQPLKNKTFGRATSQQYADGDAGIRLDYTGATGNLSMTYTPSSGAAVQRWISLESARWDISDNGRL